MKKHILLATFVTVVFQAIAQITYPVNGVADPRTGTYAFINASIVKDANTVIANGTLIIKDGKITAVGKASVPEGYVVIDCKGKFIYPSFIDIFSDYGIPIPQRTGGQTSFFGPQQLTTNTKGPFAWNQAIKSEVNGYQLFATDATKAATLRAQGFGTVVTHQKDGIARGTGTAVLLSDDKENLNIIKDKAAAYYSFSKGTSTQTYPTSIMGAVALLRQTFIDVDWYIQNRPLKEGINKSLEAWYENRSLPQIFETNDKWSGIRADRIGDEFGVQFIIKGGGDEYQRIKEIAATKAPYILPLNYPEAMNVEDPMDARYVSLTDLTHWELAPGNAAAFEKEKIPFAFTLADLKDPSAFWPALRKAIDYGLSPKAAFEALTITPARLLNLEHEVGTLDVGKWANFLITTGDLFTDKAVILENWVKGQRYPVDAKSGLEQPGQYKLAISGPSGITEYTLQVKSSNEASVVGLDTLSVKFRIDGKQVSLQLAPKTALRPVKSDSKDSSSASQTSRLLYILSGVDYGDSWQGVGMDNNGTTVNWTASLIKQEDAKRNNMPTAKALPQSKILYPFSPYGNEQLPVQQDILIKNATVWTNEKDGRLEHTDVLLKGGKIAQIGKELNAPGARIIDGTGKHLTPGIIDEHSHIACFSINEGAQSVTSEVRIGDNLNPDDINIYRQLSGGVTTSHILHGSANTIGGQTQLIKLRWGKDDAGLKFEGADPFIKFALGENVKRTAQTQGNIRFPDTRMGVQAVIADAFQRAKDYEQKLKAGDKTVRRDLELDALVEILNNKRFITCHSYVASEILGLITMAEKYGFRVNTFTHVLEGYKVADVLKKHGANTSTFSDWWAYKMEVQDAIAYNAAILYKMGLNVCINSDDAEMGRRLNQEAAKTVKYGGVPEEEALKMVTLNPAKALHIDHRVGSIKVGKDADVVLWSDHPLSIYAKALYTIVDGVVYFDWEQDLRKRKHIAKERERLLQRMLTEARSGTSVSPARPTPQLLLHCEDYEQVDGHYISAYDELHEEKAAF